MKEKITFGEEGGKSKGRGYERDVTNIKTNSTLVSDLLYSIIYGYGYHKLCMIIECS